MTDTIQPQIDASVAQLNALARRGREIGYALAAARPSPASEAAARVWQHDCAAIVSQLSGGSKAHWLSRAYSAALLVRKDEGGVACDAPITDIVGRVLGVLEQAIASLSEPGKVAAASAVPPPAVRRFDFVRNEALRPVLEDAFLDSGRALDEGDFTRSLMTSCGILEAVITDALESARLKPSRDDDDDRRAKALAEPGVTGMSFAERIAAAEARGLIRGGCARLPAAARGYRDSPDLVVTERDARTARQVLHVVLRDLDPGR